jgi:hypothetical protein
MWCYHIRFCLNPLKRLRLLRADNVKRMERNSSGIVRKRGIKFINPNKWKKDDIKTAKKPKKRVNLFILLLLLS